MNSALKDFKLPYEKLPGLATNGTMSMVGHEKPTKQTNNKQQLQALIKNELKKRLLDSNTLIVFYFFIHIKIYVHNHSIWEMS